MKAEGKVGGSGHGEAGHGTFFALPIFFEEKP
jgi:hypothetical protein